MPRCKHISPYSLYSMFRLCVTDMQKSFSPLCTVKGLQIYLKKPDDLACGAINMLAWFLCVMWIWKGNIESKTSSQLQYKPKHLQFFLMLIERHLFQWSAMGPYSRKKYVLWLIMTDSLIYDPVWIVLWNRYTMFTSIKSQFVTKLLK